MTYLHSSPIYEPTLLTDDCSGIEWTGIDCGGEHTVALNSKGKAFTWGINHCGQLGHGDMEARYTPTEIMSLRGTRIIQVSCGESFTAALSGTGDVFIW